MKFNALCLATIGGLASLLVPASAHAGNVGYFVSGNPAGCIAPTDAIVQAGHTPVALTQIDAASLAPLDALILISCVGTTPANAALDAAVAGGMGLVVDSSDYFATVHPYLPGAATLVTEFGCATDYDLSPASPIATGPGGNLDNTSFDFPEGICATTGFVNGPAPAGATPFLQDAISGKVVALGYDYASGRVAFTMSSFSRTGLDVQAMSWWPAGRSYLANALAWTLEAREPTTTCASEGYRGTQLTWCKNICENGLSGQVLDTWIHRWINRYRQLPYCAVEGEPRAR